MVHTVWSYWFVIYWFSEMKISQRNVKVNANLLTWIVQCRAPTPTASWNAEESWPIVPKVRDLTLRRLFMILMGNIPSLIRLLKIVHVMSTAQMVVMVARIRFVSVVRIHCPRMKIIYNSARRKQVLILANASLIAKTMNPVRNPVLLCSKNSMLSAHVK